MNLSHWVEPLLSLLGQVQFKICQAMVQITILLICYHSFLIHIIGTYFSNRCSRVILESTCHQLLKHNFFELNIVHCIENCLLLWGSHPAQKKFPCVNDGPHLSNYISTDRLPMTITKREAIPRYWQYGTHEYSN